MNFYIVFFAEFDRAAVHNARAETCHFEYLVIADLVDLDGLFVNARVGRIDAVNIGIDFAHLGLQGRRKRHRAGIRAAAAERGDIFIFIDALKAGDNDDLAVVEMLFYPFAVDALDACLCMNAVGHHSSSVRRSY